VYFYYPQPKKITRIFSRRFSTMPPSAELVGKNRTEYFHFLGTGYGQQEYFKSEFNFQTAYYKHNTLGTAFSKQEIFPINSFLKRELST
jgi:hypothetical protein